MCGRYALTSSAEVLANLFDAAVRVDLVERYNIAPTQPVPIVRQDRRGRRTIDLVRWGLVPSWAKDVSIGSRMINARSETVAEKPGYRGAFRYRRCLIPADGFYEWKAPKTGKGPKQPHLIRMADEAPFAMAGLWETWSDANGNELDSCVILTTSANEMIAPIHERMPVILAKEDYATWLDPNLDTPEAMEKIIPLLQPFPAEQMIAQPVSTRVNNARNDDRGCMEADTLFNA